MHTRLRTACISGFSRGDMIRSCSSKARQAAPDVSGLCRKAGLTAGLRYGGRSVSTAAGAAVKTRCCAGACMQANKDGAPC